MEEWFTENIVEVEYHDGNGETHMSPWEVDWSNVARWRPQPEKEWVMRRLRDNLAMAALSGMCVREENTVQSTAIAAYEYADAMLAARGGK